LISRRRDWAAATHWYTTTLPGIRDYIDVREDRVIFYGAIGTEARTFVYRLKPTNPGRFAVPPLYAEGMYDRSVQARSLGASFTIGDEVPPAHR
jgi:uncharacterized protein YfaS (alpha-2-macroglobulin family)